MPTIKRIKRRGDPKRPSYTGVVTAVSTRAKQLAMQNGLTERLDTELPWRQAQEIHRQIGGNGKATTQITA